MTRLRQVARSSLSVLARRPPAEAPVRSMPGPLSALWYFLEIPVVLPVCLGMLAMLGLSALISPGLYLHQSNTFGWPTSNWPTAFQRLAALALLGSAPWSQAILSTLFVLAVVRAASRLGLALQPSVHPDPGLARAANTQRARFYTEVKQAQAVRRVKRSLALLGYCLQPQAGSEATFLASAGRSRAWAQSVAGGALAGLALLGLLAPKVTLAEVVDLEPGKPRQLQSGLLVSASHGPTVTVQTSDSGAPRPVPIRRPILLGSVLFIWHGSGPALAVSAVTDNPAGYDLLIPFLPDQPIKYITVPETGVSLRVSLTPTDSGAEFEVQPLTQQGQPTGPTHAIAEATVIPVEKTDLALAPAQYQVVSALRAPLWWPGLAVALLSVGAFVVGLLSSGPSLTVALSERAGITTVEVERHSTPATHDLWRRVLDLALR